MSRIYDRPYFRPQAWGESTIPKENLSNSFYKKVRPVLLILRAFGKFPYRMTDEGILPFSMWSVPTIYCLVANAFIVYFSVGTFLQLIEDSYWKSKAYDEKLLIIIAISFLSHNFLVPLTFWLPAPSLVKYIESWSRYQYTFEKDFMKIRNPEYVKYLSIISVPVAFVHVFLVVYTFLDSNFGLTLVFYPVVIVAYMTLILWYTSLFELRFQAEALRCSIVKEERPSDLDNKRRCWATISQLTLMTGDCQGSSCGYFTLSAFISFLICIYGFFSGLLVGNEDSKVGWNLFLPLTIYTIYFYFMFDVGDTVSKQVGKKFISTILKIRDTQPCHIGHNDELSLFLLTMYAGEPKITFTGFIVIKRGLIKSLASNTLTFLLILIQFKS